MGSLCGCAKKAGDKSRQITTEKARSLASKSDELCCDNRNPEKKHTKKKLSRLERAERLLAESDKTGVNDCIADCYYSYPTDHIDSILSNGTRLSQLLNVSKQHCTEESLPFLINEKSEMINHIRKAWDFWIDQMKSPRFICAPMVNQSDFHFRLLCRKYGVPLCYTPMVNSRQYMKDVGGRANMFATVQIKSALIKPIKSSLPRDILSVFTPDTLPPINTDQSDSDTRAYNSLMDAYPDRSVNQIDRPLIIQICGNDPDKMVACAKHFETLCDGIDINFGCPQSIARKGFYGAFLLDDVPLMCRLVNSLTKSMSVPILVKIRVQPTFDATLLMCQLLFLSGASLIAIHGRTREMKKQLTRECNFEWIRRIKLALPIPIVANGGCHTLEEAEHCLRVTGVDGYMSAEALLHNPSMFLRPMTDEEKEVYGRNRKIDQKDRWWDVAQRKSVCYQDFAQGENRCEASCISSLVCVPPLSPVRMAKDMIEILHTFDPTRCFSLRADSLSERQIRGHLFKILYRELSILHEERDILSECKLHILMNKVWPGLVEKKSIIGEKDWNDLYSMTSCWYFRWFHSQPGEANLARRCESKKRCLRLFFKQMKLNHFNLITDSESEQIKVHELLNECISGMKQELREIEILSIEKQKRRENGESSSDEDEDDSMLEKEGQFVTGLFCVDQNSDSE